jgi:TolB protein
LTGIKPITRRALLLITIGLVTDAGLRPAAAEDEANKANPRRLSIAGPEASDDPTPDAPSWRNIAAIVTAQLKASGRFALIEPDAPIEGNIYTVPAFDKWRSIDTEWLLTGRVTQPNGRLKVEFRLWNVITGQQLRGEQYFLQPEQWRDVPQIVADAILKRFNDK